MKTSGDTLLSLIEEILDFSKIEAGRLDLEARPFALGALVEETVELLAPRAQAKGLEIASSIDERLPSTRGRRCGAAAPGAAQSRRQCGEVHRNRRRRASSSSPATQPDEISFPVRDTGIGIAPDAQARIFEEFEQADGGTTRKFGGTGLGLAISRRIVERMGGSIDVESAPGAGSTFSFTVALPRAPTSDAPFAPPDLDRPGDPDRVAPSTIEAPLVGATARTLGREDLPRAGRSRRARCCPSGIGTPS